ncbi:unnamed protein product [Spirodela intermedia]|uniref:Uncharacterized protein n=1 Tax=Spirodela intermedia TaxID=51605 RepID=A0A7I8IEG5_SPIIN|nr:unnamed protein product [Spirodela intermedia]CAA6656011.1 unnamed protein product [Spirodela intermedia]
MPTTINLSEEYREVIRTQSYEEVYAQIHRHLRQCIAHSYASSPPQPQEDENLTTARTAPQTLRPTSSPVSSLSSPFFCYSSLPQHLLEPHDQEALLASVQDPDLHGLFIDYFNASLEACNICGTLLWSIEQLRRDHDSVQRLFNQVVDRADLASYVELQNPLFALKTSLIRRLTLARDRILRRAQLLDSSRGRRVSPWCGVWRTGNRRPGAGGAGGVVLVVAGVPAMVFPFSAWVRRRTRPWRAHRLVRLAAQLDSAARGAYIMSRDMETISRMVTRLHDEVEHEKGVLRLFLRRRERFVQVEAAEGSGGGGGGLAEQLEELEEHVYWCLLTIKRTRGSSHRK